MSNKKFSKRIFCVNVYLVPHISMPFLTSLSQMVTTHSAIESSTRGNSSKELEFPTMVGSRATLCFIRPRRVIEDRQNLIAPSHCDPVSQALGRFRFVRELFSVISSSYERLDYFRS